MTDTNKNWQDAKEAQLRTWLEKPRKGIITDVDGTISPIVDTPDAAQVTPRSKELLTELVNYMTVVGVISGRAAGDVQARVGVPGMVYVGNHGMERWRDGQVEIPQTVRVHRPGMEAVLQATRPYEESLPGVLVEDKDASLSIHYRKAADPKSVANTLRPLLNELSQENNLRVFEGRMIFEVRPPLDMNKGSALRALVQEYTLDAALYMGDDTTDVDAINAARDLREAEQCYAFGFGVAGEETPAPVLESADFLLDGVSGVEAFLAWMLNALKASSS